MSRLATIGDGTDTYASYKYLGAGRIVVEDYEDVEVKLDYSADNFAALDRFGRVLDQLWTDYGADPGVVLDHYSYTYDRAGNRTSRTNELNHDFDELYEYDGIDRLISSTRADDFDQSWTLDGLGNFAEFDDDGDTQTRTANAANEITNITGGWVTPTYDQAGNLIAGPKPGDGATQVHYVYDAWNRLVRVYDDDSGDPGNLIAEYEYDGTNRRIEKIVAGTSHAHYYFNQDWQLLEERFVDEQDELLASSQYVWSARYIDAPVVRFHDGNGDGDLLDVEDNIRYYTGDANYNVTSTIDATTGEVVDRYVYTAYGKATVYDDDWSNPSAPTTDGPLYCGYFFDAESALYQVRNRYYDAGLSTFISRDPLGFDAGDFNLFRYCANNPTNSFDPLGLSDISPAIGEPMVPPRNVVWPGSGSASASKPNKKTLLGYNVCCFTPPTRDKRVSKIPGVVTYNPPSTGAGTGQNIIYGPPTANVGTAGAAPCVALIVNCPGSGVAVFHFTAGDDPAGTLGSMTWPAGCKAIVCGGDNSRDSNCLADYVIDAAKSKFKLEGVSDSNGCGVTKDGKWWVNGKVG